MRTILSSSSRLLCPLSPLFMFRFFCPFISFTHRKPSFLHFSPYSPASRPCCSHIFAEILFIYLFTIIFRANRTYSAHQKKWFSFPIHYFMPSGCLSLRLRSSCSSSSGFFGGFVCVCARTRRHTDDACAQLRWKWFELFCGSVWRWNGPPPSDQQQPSSHHRKPVLFPKKMVFNMCRCRSVARRQQRRHRRRRRWHRMGNWHCRVRNGNDDGQGKIVRFKMRSEDDRRRRASARVILSLANRSRSRRMALVHFNEIPNCTVPRTKHVCIFPQHNHSHTVIVNCNCLNLGSLAIKWLVACAWCSYRFLHGACSY